MDLDDGFPKLGKYLSISVDSRDARKNHTSIARLGKVRAILTFALGLLCGYLLMR